MKKKLIILLLFSFSISGTMYLAYDTDDAEIITLGYNHMYKQFETWTLAIGGNYDVDTPSGLAFASIYALPIFPINNQISFWVSIGYGIIADDGGFEEIMANSLSDYRLSGSVNLSSGLTHGFGLHFNLNEKIGLGLGTVTNTLDLELELLGLTVDGDIDDLERSNIYLSYTF